MTALRTASSGGGVSDRALRRGAWSIWWVFVAALLLSSAAPVMTAGTDALPAVSSDAVFVLIVATYPFTGILILRRQPRNRIGWVLLAIGGCWAFGGLTEACAVLGADARPPWPGTWVAAALNQGIWFPALGLMTTFLILLYPDGRLPGPGWRWVGRLCGATLVAGYVAVTLDPGEIAEGVGAGRPNPLGLELAGNLLAPASRILLAMLPVATALCLTGLVVRYRRSRGILRQQMRWLAAAGTVTASLFAVSMGITVAGASLGVVGDPPGWVLLQQNITVVSLALVPAAIGIAILRYRLYDIDVVIQRTLVYASLTASLVATYLLLVLTLQTLLRPVAGDSDLAVAASTLAVAALFRPLRGALQRGVDRRFFRARYDATRTVTEFSGRLRHELDLDSVGTDLRAVVRDTVQPAHVSLWLRRES
jgi:hypothetical protein